MILDFESATGPDQAASDGTQRYSKSPTKRKGASSKSASMWSFHGFKEPTSGRATDAPAAVGPSDEGVDIRPAALAAHDAAVVQADDRHVLGVGQRMHHCPKGQLVPLPHGLQPAHIPLRFPSEDLPYCCQLIIPVHTTSSVSEFCSCRKPGSGGVRFYIWVCHTSAQCRLEH